MSISRRQFLKLSCCSMAAASVANGLTRFGLVNSTVNAATDYKALVCVFLFGGNDANNMIIPYDTPRYLLYEKGRAGLVIPRNQLYAITTASGGQYGLHPKLTRMSQLYGSKQLALLANTGVTPRRSSQGQRNGCLPRKPALPSGPAERMADRDRCRSTGKRMGRPPRGPTASPGRQ